MDSSQVIKKVNTYIKRLELSSSSVLSLLDPPLVSKTKKDL